MCFGASLRLCATEKKLSLPLSKLRAPYNRVEFGRSRFRTRSRRDIRRNLRYLVTALIRQNADYESLFLKMVRLNTTVLLPLTCGMTLQPAWRCAVNVQKLSMIVSVC